MKRTARRARGALSAAFLAAACGGADPARNGVDAQSGPATDDDPQAAFWESLQALCGGAYEGRLMEAPAGDTTFADRRLVMHVRTCTDDEIRFTSVKIGRGRGCCPAPRTVCGSSTTTGTLTAARTRSRSTAATRRRRVPRSVRSSRRIRSRQS